MITKTKPERKSFWEQQALVFTAVILMGLVMALGTQNADAAVRAAFAVGIFGELLIGAGYWLHRK